MQSYLAKGETWWQWNKQWKEEGRIELSWRVFEPLFFMNKIFVFLELFHRLSNCVISHVYHFWDHLWHKRGSKICTFLPRKNLLEFIPWGDQDQWWGKCEWEWSLIRVHTSVLSALNPVYITYWWNISPLGFMHISPEKKNLRRGTDSTWLENYK